LRDPLTLQHPDFPSRSFWALDGSIQEPEQQAEEELTVLVVLLVEAVEIRPAQTMQ